MQYHIRLNFLLIIFLRFCTVINHIKICRPFFIRSGMKHVSEMHFGSFRKKKIEYGKKAFLNFDCQVIECPTNKSIEMTENSNKKKIIQTEIVFLFSR